MIISIDHLAMKVSHMTMWFPVHFITFSHHLRQKSGSSTVVKSLRAKTGNTGDAGSIPGFGRYSGVGNG